MKNTATETRDYHYTECGLDNVLIRNMPVVVDDDGDEIIDIPGINLLHAMILHELSEKKGSWTASELRFVRTELGFTQSELGDLIGKDRQTVARWEKDETDIDNNAEVVMRLLSVDHLSAMGTNNDQAERAERPKVRDISAWVKPGAANSQIIINRVGDSYSREVAA